MSELQRLKKKKKGIFFKKSAAFEEAIPNF